MAFRSKKASWDHRHFCCPLTLIWSQVRHADQVWPQKWESDCGYLIRGVHCAWPLKYLQATTLLAPSLLPSILNLFQEAVSSIFIVDSFPVSVQTLSLSSKSTVKDLWDSTTQVLPKVTVPFSYLPEPWMKIPECPLTLSLRSPFSVSRRSVLRLLTTQIVKCCESSVAFSACMRHFSKTWMVPPQTLISYNNYQKQWPRVRTRLHRKSRQLHIISNTEHRRNLCPYISFR